MKVPALAARAPAGATQTIVGMPASSSAETIFCVASRLPPGVLILITTAGAPAACARAIPSARYPASTESTTPVADSTGTLGDAPRTPPARRSRAPASVARSDRRRPARDVISRRLSPRCQGLEHELAPRLEVLAHGLHVRVARPLRCELVGLADCHGSPAGLGLEHDPEMDGADIGRVVVEESDEPQRRPKVGLDLLRPLALEAAHDAVVARVQVTADTQRVAVMKPRVHAGAGPTHQEPADAIAQDEVRDELLARWIGLDGGTRAVLAGTLEAGDLGAVDVASHAAPGAVGERDVAWDDVDQLLRHLVNARERHARAPAGRRARGRPVRPPRGCSARRRSRIEATAGELPSRPRSYPASRRPSPDRHGPAGWHSPIRSRRGCGRANAATRRRPRWTRRARRRRRAAAG